MLQAQCRRLEAQHYSLSLTAEQLSHSMAVSLRDRTGSGGAFLTPQWLFSFSLSSLGSGAPIQTSFEGKLCS